MARQEHESILHFAYGANMNPQQIAARCSRAKPVAVARLPDFELSFHGHSEVWDGGWGASSMTSAARSIATPPAGYMIAYNRIRTMTALVIAMTVFCSIGRFISPNGFIRAGAGPRFEFAKRQKELYEAQRVLRSAEIEDMRGKRDGLRSAQARVAADALVIRDQQRSLFFSKRDALQLQVDAACAVLKQLEDKQLANVTEFRRKALADIEHEKSKNDPLSRMTAYQELKSDQKDGATIVLFSWMTKAFIIFLEIVPVIAKVFFSPPSVYAVKIQAEVAFGRVRVKSAERNCAAQQERNVEGMEWIRENADALPGDDELLRDFQMAEPDKTILGTAFRQQESASPATSVEADRDQAERPAGIRGLFSRARKRSAETEPLEDKKFETPPSKLDVPSKFEAVRSDAESEIERTARGHRIGR